jgi:DNA-binding MarR family transcriptional regulator
MLCFSLYAAMHAMQAAYRPLLEPLGLTYPQYLVMSALWGQDGLSVGQIGQALHLDSNTLTPLIKRLQGAGLITRTRSTADERQVLVTLTDAGRAMAQRAAEIPACVLKASDLTTMQADILRDRLTALQKSLRASADGPAPKPR